MKLEKELGYITNQIREVSEATAAGRSARESADSILTSLGSAESWGTWDLFGGGMISDFANITILMKHNRRLNISRCSFVDSKLSLLTSRYPLT